MNDLVVKKARREKQKAVVGLIGPSGAGKTVSALRVAYGMMREAYPDLPEEEVWAKIGVADTEHSRSTLYWNRQYGSMVIGEFLHVDFRAPYTTDRYAVAINALKQAGAEVIIIDSLSHNWSGEGGIVEQHDGMEGNSFRNWSKMAPHTHKMIRILTTNNVHMIATFRTKQDYVVEVNDKGKQQPRKVGTKPVQKDEMEYEFMLNLNIDMDNMATPSKDNTDLFKGKRVLLTEDDGKVLYQWLENGVDVKAEAENKRQDLIKQVEQLVGIDEKLKKELRDIENKSQMDYVNFPVQYLNKAIRVLTNK